MIRLTREPSEKIETSISPDPVPEPRKFSVPSTTEPFPSGPAGSNIDSIVEASTGLRSVAMVTEQLAALARSEVTTARAAIAALTPEITTAPAIRPQVDENDVATEQDRQISIIRRALPQFSSTSLNSGLSSAAAALVRQSRQTFVPLQSVQRMQVENKMVPDLDSVTLQLKKGKGVGDSFFASVTVSIPIENIDDGNVASIRVFRATIISPTLSRPPADMSMRGMDVIMSRPAASRAKSEHALSHLARRLDEDGVANDMSILNPFDRFIKQRVAASPVKLRSSRAIDASVSENTRFIDARRLQDPDFGLYGYDPTVTAGSTDIGSTSVGDAHSQDLDSGASRFGMSISKNNSAGFRQIFVAKPSGFQMKKIGKRYYLTFDDESVVFGRQYQYYAVTVDKNMVQSNRSAVATINVDGLRVPARPKNVLISSDAYNVTLFATCDDQFVEKFEIWRKSPNDGVSAKNFIVYKAQNGYSFVDEIVNAEHKGGANWVDSEVIPGHEYAYRVYSVDVFGNKSESPFEVSIIVPDIFNGDDKNLKRPTILAEVDAKTQKIRVTFSCQDSNVKKLLLERRDLSIAQDNFIVPFQSSRNIMGPRRFKHGSYIDGERVQDLDNISLWNGWFDNTPGNIVFIDRLTSYDRTYQYRVYGIDDRGNRTAYDYSAPVMVQRKPMINVPVNLSSTFVTGAAGDIAGVMLTWQSSSLDISSEDKLGSQSTLADTSVRTLYQVERQKPGERWLMFNMTENQQIFDPVVGYSGTLAPEYRPPFVEFNTQYNYRVQAVLSGGYVSNKAEQISVFVGYSIASPMNFTLKTPDPRTRPFYVMLNWQTQPNTGVVDRWEIERFEMNNKAADRMQIRSESVVSKLAFEAYRTVFKESSRFRSFWPDYLHKDARSAVIQSEHHFMDSKVTFGNTYFYKIYAVDSRGNRSAPVYRAIRLTYSSFERMIEEVLSSDERRRLTINPVPFRPSANIVTPSPLNTLSLVPTFATPSMSIIKPVTRLATLIRNRLIT